MCIFNDNCRQTPCPPSNYGLVGSWSSTSRNQRLMILVLVQRARHGMLCFFQKRTPTKNEIEFENNFLFAHARNNLHTHTYKLYPHITLRIIWISRKWYYINKYISLATNFDLERFQILKLCKKYYIILNQNFDEASYQKRKTKCIMKKRRTDHQTNK